MSNLRVANHDDDDNDDAERSAAEMRLESEQDFFVRFGKFLMLLLVFFCVMFFSEMKNDEILFIMGVLVFTLFLSYMCGSLAYNLYVGQKNDLSNILTEEELAGTMNDSDDDEDDYGVSRSSETRMAMCPLNETPRMIRSCRSEITYYRPKSGQYSIVYNAVYFGKSIRSESQLQLQFEEARKSNGWEIKGSIISGNGSSSNSNNKDSNQSTATSRSIADGFINTRGEMYWRTANPQDKNNMDGIYRGCYDFRSCTMYDGEFKAGLAPKGRIVRMELLEENIDQSYIHYNHQSNNNSNSEIISSDDWGSPNIDDEWGSHDDVEMVDLDSNKGLV